MIKNTEEIMNMNMMEFIQFINRYNLQITLEEKNDKTTFDTLSQIINKINEIRRDKYTLQEVAKFLSLTTSEVNFFYKRLPKILGQYTNTQSFTETDITRLKIVKFLNKTMKYDLDLVNQILK